MLSPWRYRDDFDDKHDEVLHLVKGRNRNHPGKEKDNSHQKKKNQVSLKNLLHSACDHVILGLCLVI